MDAVVSRARADTADDALGLADPSSRGGARGVADAAGAGAPQGQDAAPPLVVSGLRSVYERLKHLCEALLSPLDFTADLGSALDDDNDDGVGSVGVGVVGVDDLLAKRTTTKILGDYTEKDIFDALRAHGIIARVRELGFTAPYVVANLSDPFVHEVTLMDKSLDGAARGSHFLIDVFVRRVDFRVRDDAHAALAPLRRFLGGGVLRMSTIEYLCMQHPRAAFAPGPKPQLPGQRHPGLGCGRMMIETLSDLAREHGRDGLLNVPDYFHNGLMYFRTGFRFLSPLAQAAIELLAGDLAADVAVRGLAAVSWAFTEGKVVRVAAGDGSVVQKTVLWSPEEQALPTGDRLAQYFASDEYLALVTEEMVRDRAESRFAILWDRKIAVGRVGK